MTLAENFPAGPLRYGLIIKAKHLRHTNRRGMEPGFDPRATDVDLTLKARIRNAALDLYARDGEDRVSMRAIATAVGGDDRLGPAPLRQ
jgi:hypothetical protein